MDCSSKAPRALVTPHKRSFSSAVLAEDDNKRSGNRMTCGAANVEVQEEAALQDLDSWLLTSNPSTTDDLATATAPALHAPSLPPRVRARSAMRVQLQHEQYCKRAAGAVTCRAASDAERTRRTANYLTAAVLSRQAAAATEAAAASEAAADTEAELEEASLQLHRSQRALQQSENEVLALQVSLHRCQAELSAAKQELAACQAQQAAARKAMPKDVRDKMSWLHRTRVSLNTLKRWHGMRGAPPCTQAANPAAALKAPPPPRHKERDTLTGAYTAAYACSNAALLTLPNVSCQQLGPLRTAVAAAEFPDAPPQPQAGPSTVRRHQQMLTRKIQGTFKSQLSKAPAVHVQMDGCTIKNGKVVLFCASASIPAPVPSLPTSSLTAGPPTPLAADPPTPLAAGPPTPLAAGPPTPLAVGPPTPAQILTHGQEPSRILCRVLDIRKCPDSTAAAQAHDLEQLLKEANLWELLASVTVDSAASNVGRTGGLVALVNMPGSKKLGNGLAGKSQASKAQSDSSESRPRPECPGVEQAAKAMEALQTTDPKKLEVGAQDHTVSSLTQSPAAGGSTTSMGPIGGTASGAITARLPPLVSPHHHSRPAAPAGAVAAPEPTVGQLQMEMVSLQSKLQTEQVAVIKLRARVAQLEPLEHTRLIRERFTSAKAQLQTASDDLVRVTARLQELLSLPFLSAEQAEEQAKASAMHTSLRQDIARLTAEVNSCATAATATGAAELDAAANELAAAQRQTQLERTLRERAQEELRTGNAHNQARCRELEGQIESPKHNYPEPVPCFNENVLFSFMATSEAAGANPSLPLAAGAPGPSNAVPPLPPPITEDEELWQEDAFTADELEAGPGLYMGPKEHEAVQAWFATGPANRLRHYLEYAASMKLGDLANHPNWGPSACGLHFHEWTQCVRPLFAEKDRKRPASAPPSEDGGCGARGGGRGGRTGGRGRARGRGDYSREHYHNDPNNNRGGRGGRGGRGEGRGGHDNRT
ncbi:hypothetical protein QJQ45_008756 [Haematococcus lacustris]|nr:hypothetical protein QJQ45_008756 [Haematococcus lacustris]